jgi:hypothetical protein
MEYKWKKKRGDGIMTFMTAGDPVVTLQHLNAATQLKPMLLRALCTDAGGRREDIRGFHFLLSGREIRPAFKNP